MVVHQPITYRSRACHHTAHFASEVPVIMPNSIMSGPSGHPMTLNPGFVTDGLLCEYHMP